jgi:hypothetical protein
LAQQFAWQLEKNVSNGSKAIYFKTSASFDVSGERLLGLFVDLINLLPPDIRANVTFSTYPVSLPGGTSCHLRGIYDRDKFFDTSAATQAWVDCENAKIVHPEMLPTRGSAKPQTPVLEKGKNAATTSQVRQHNGSKFSTPKVSGRGPDPNSYRNLFPPKKHGPDILVISLIVGTALILLVGAGVFFWMMQSNKKQMEDSGAAAAVENEKQIRSLETEREIAERKAEEERREQQLKELEQKQKAEKEAAERVRKQQEAENAAKEKEKAEKREAAKKREEIAKREAEDAKKKADEKKHKQIAYLDAKEFRRGYPSYAYDSSKKRSKEPFMLDDGCCVYYYSGGVVVNEPAGFKVNKNNPQFASLRWGGDLSRKLEEIPLVSNGFVLWYNPTLKIVYIDLNRRLSQSEDGETWFANSSSVDLAQKYFGSDPNFKKLWEKYRGGRTKYLIQWKLSAKCKSVKPFLTEKAEWTDVKMIAEMQKKGVKDYEDKIVSSEQKRLNLQKELDKKLLPELQELQADTNSMKKVLFAWQNESCEISKLESEIRMADKDKPQNYEKIKEEKRGEMRKHKERQESILALGTDKPDIEKGGKDKKRVYKDINDLQKRIKSKEQSVDAKQKDVKNKKKEIKDAETDVASAKQAKDEFIMKFKDDIRKVLFSLCVEGETIKE